METQTKDSLNLIYKDNSQKKLSLDKTINIKNDFINLPDGFDRSDKIVFINISHNQVISTLNLTKITPYIILFFDKDLKFVGATISKQKKRAGSFCLKTEYKTLLLIKINKKIQLKDLLKIKK